MKYLIYSREHNAWWRDNRAGYTFEEEEAGRYSLKEAKAIVARSKMGWNRAGAPEFYYPELQPSAS